MENIPKISLVGAGRFGSFFGEELSRFFEVIYYDKKKQDCHTKIYKDLDECLNRELIFLAIPISEIENFLIENGKKIPSSSVLIDLSSVKLKPEECCIKYLPSGNQYYLTHPLFGPDSAKFSIEGQKIVTAGGRINGESKAFIDKVFTDKLKLSILELSPDVHDRLMAYNLSLMHHLGRAFNEMGILDLELKMRSLSDISRITQFVMNDSEQLFRDFYKYNPYSNQIRLEFEKSFSKISGIL